MRTQRVRRVLSCTSGCRARVVLNAARGSHDARRATLRGSARAAKRSTRPRPFCGADSGSGAGLCWPRSKTPRSARRRRRPRILWCSVVVRQNQLQKQTGTLVISLPTRPRCCAPHRRLLNRLDPCGTRSSHSRNLRINMHYRYGQHEYPWVYKQRRPLQEKDGAERRSHDQAVLLHPLALARLLALHALALRALRDAAALLLALLPRAVREQVLLRL
jgi:hypothetical protein